MTAANVKTAQYYAIVEVLEENKGFVVANDPYTGAIVPHLIPVIKKENSLSAGSSAKHSWNMFSH